MPGPLLARSSSRRAEALAIGRACRDCGFFYVVGHGVSTTLARRPRRASRAFFALPLEEKLAIAWRAAAAPGAATSRSAAS